MRVEKGWKSKPELSADYTPELRVSRGVQLAQIFNESECNTPMLKYAEVKINHVEGGWPKVRSFLRYNLQTRIVQLLHEHIPLLSIAHCP